MLGQVRDAFPLPGHYHFRFKSPLFPGADREKGAMAVWMDVVNDSAAVPTWKNSIVAKVTRVSAEDDDDDDDDEDFGHHHAPAASAPPPQQQSHQPRAPPSHHSSAGASHASADSAHLDIFGDSPSAGGSAAPTPAAAPNLFDAVPKAPASGASVDSLLDMNDFGSQPSQASSHPHADFLGMTAPTPAAAPTPQRPQQGYPGQQNNMYNATPQQQQQQQRPPQGSFQQQQQPFGGLGTPWK